ncbi:MAG: hypothetical protein JWM93_3428 [Frankiales bacterium]|nr:hypothetical protein [Frankiales bacterium]
MQTGLRAAVTALCAALLLAPAAAIREPAAAAATAPLSTPMSAQLTAATALPSRHVVQPKDTIRSVAARYGLAWRDVARWNELPYPYTLHTEGALRLTPARLPLAPFTSLITVPTMKDTHWREGCPVAFNALRLVWVTYIDFAGLTHQGYVVVHRSIAAKIPKIFKKLYDARYRIYAMAPLAVNTPGSTDESVATLAYNCRSVTNGASYSQHAYGTAVDVNPAQNPFISSSGAILPETATLYVNRASYRIGIMHRGGTVVNAFAAAGLAWGGLWHYSKDYMHFSVTGR